MIPMHTIVLMIIFSVIPGLGCYNEEQQQQLQICESICAEPADLCNDFIYEDCVAGCMDKSGVEFMSLFEDCVDCYTSVQCDAASFAVRCLGYCAL